ncbi:MAG: hypothetical protein WD267_00670 [Balneolales bacterium]
MLKSLQIPLFCLSALMILNACESPESPDFTTEHTFNLPLISNLQMEVMGGANALIDTTTLGFDTLFTADPEGMMSISTRMDFDFGDFSDAIPEIEIDDISIDSEIGIIEVDDFSSSFESELGTLSKDAEPTTPEEVELGVFNVSFSGTGSSSFNEITGDNAEDFPPGTPVPGRTSTIDIDLDAGNFQWAEVNSGGIRITFTNDLGFEIDNIDAVLHSGGLPIGSELNLTSVTTGSTDSGVIEFDPGDFIENDLYIEVELTWVTRNTEAQPENLLVDAQDEELIVNSAESDVPAQALEPSSPGLEIENENFVYAIVEDSEIIENGLNDITIEILNNTNLPITNSSLIGMPELSLFNDDGDLLDVKKPIIKNDAPGDAPGASSLGPNESGTVVFDLRGQKLTKNLSFLLDTGTDGTDGGVGMEVNSEDSFTITSTTGELNFLEAESDVEAQEDIDLDDTAIVEGDFVNAEVDEGELYLTFNNETNLPLVIDELRIFNAQAFKAKNTGHTFMAGSDIGIITNLPIPAGTSRTETLDIAGKGISDQISYEGTASSEGTNGIAVLIQSGDLITIDLEGSIQLNSTTAVLKSQDFSTIGEIEIDDEFFELQTNEHYVELSSGQLRILDLINEIDLDLDTLQISFPGIRVRNITGNYEEKDSLTISMTGTNKILRSSSNSEAYSTSLEGARIYAPNNILKYNVKAITENTREHAGGDTTRTVNSVDKIVANVEIQNLVVGNAKGLVKSRTILINDDDENNGEDVSDLFNDNEVVITQLDDLDELTSRVSNLAFYEPSLNLFYDTNLGVDATIYAAILGVNKDGEQVYLSGKDGSDLEVASIDNISGLMSNGADISIGQLVKFKVEKNTSSTGNTSNVLVFDSENSTIETFLSNLPKEIRFIGKAVVNENEDEGEISDPVEFNTSMGIDIPINLATETPAVFQDTLSQDLSDLPGEGDDNMVSHANLSIMYENRMPFTVELTLDFLDTNGNLITTVPQPATDESQIKINAASVDVNTRFTTSAQSGELDFTLNRDQLEKLYRTTQIIIHGDFTTSSQEQIKLRAEDYINLSVFGKFKVESRVN